MRCGSTMESEAQLVDAKGSSRRKGNSAWCSAENATAVIGSTRFAGSWLAPRPIQGDTAAAAKTFTMPVIDVAAIEDPAGQERGAVGGRGGGVTLRSGARNRLRFPDIGMPIVDIEAVTGTLDAEASSQETSQFLADELGSLFDSETGRSRARLRTLDQNRYAENGPRRTLMPVLRLLKSCEPNCRRPQSCGRNRQALRRSWRERWAVRARTYEYSTRATRRVLWASAGRFWSDRRRRPVSQIGVLRQWPASLFWLRLHCRTRRHCGTRLR